MSRRAGGGTSLEHVMHVDPYEFNLQCFNGDYEKTAKLFPALRNMSVTETLIDRVLSGKKPMGTGLQSEMSDDDIALLGRSGLVVEWHALGDAASSMWGRGFVMCKEPNKSLMALLNEREWQERSWIRGLPRVLAGRTIASYLGGFDHAETLYPHNEVCSWLECALLFGYPLELARTQCRSEVEQTRLKRWEGQKGALKNKYWSVHGEFL